MGGIKREKYIYEKLTKKEKKNYGMKSREIKRKRLCKRNIEESKRKKKSSIYVGRISRLCIRNIKESKYKIIRIVLV